MALRTIHIEVMDKGRFNPQHTIGQAKPLLAPWLSEWGDRRDRVSQVRHWRVSFCKVFSHAKVKDAVENSGAAIELFAPVQGLELTWSWEWVSFGEIQSKLLKTVSASIAARLASLPPWQYFSL